VLIVLPAWLDALERLSQREQSGFQLQQLASDDLLIKLGDVSSGYEPKTGVVTFASIALMSDHILVFASLACNVRETKCYVQIGLDEIYLELGWFFRGLKMIKHRPENYRGSVSPASLDHECSIKSHDWAQGTLKRFGAGHDFW